MKNLYVIDWVNHCVVEVQARETAHGYLHYEIDSSSVRVKKQHVMFPSHGFLATLHESKFDALQTLVGRERALLASARERVAEYEQHVRLSWKWRKRSSVKITERTYEEGTEAFHARRKSSHPEAASCGQSTRLGAV